MQRCRPRSAAAAAAVRSRPRGPALAEKYTRNLRELKEAQVEASRERVFGPQGNMPGDRQWHKPLEGKKLMRWYFPSKYAFQDFRVDDYFEMQAERHAPREPHESMHMLHGCLQKVMQDREKLRAFFGQLDKPTFLDTPAFQDLYGLFRLVDADHALPFSVSELVFRQHGPLFSGSAPIRVAGRAPSAEDDELQAAWLALSARAGLELDASLVAAKTREEAQEAMQEAMQRVGYVPFSAEKLVDAWRMQKAPEPLAASAAEVPGPGDQASSASAPASATEASETAHQIIEVWGSSQEPAKDLTLRAELQGGESIAGEAAEAKDATAEAASAASTAEAAEEPNSKEAASANVSEEAEASTKAEASQEAAGKDASQLSDNEALLRLTGPAEERTHDQIAADEAAAKTAAAAPAEDYGLDVLKTTAKAPAEDTGPKLYWDEVQNKWRHEGTEQEEANMGSFREDEVGTVDDLLASNPDAIPDLPVPQRIAEPIPTLQLGLFQAARYQGGTPKEKATAAKEGELELKSLAKSSRRVKEWLARRHRFVDPMFRRRRLKWLERQLGGLNKEREQKFNQYYMTHPDDHHEWPTNKGSTTVKYPSPYH